MLYVLSIIVPVQGIRKGTQSPAEVTFQCPLQHTEALRHFPLRKPFDPSEPNHIATWTRQSVHRFRQSPKLLVCAQVLLGRQVICENV